MNTHIYEEPEFLLYKSLFKEFKLTNEFSMDKNFKYYFESEKIDESDYSIWKKIKKLFNSDRTLFVILKREDGLIIYSNVIKISTNKTIMVAYDFFKKEFENIDRDNNISLNITILVNKENKTILNKFKDEFCYLENLKKLPEKECSLKKLNDKIFNSFPLLLLSMVAVLGFITIDKFSKFGILISYISFDTLSLLLNISITNILFILFLFLMFILVYIVILTLISIYSKALSCEQFSSVMTVSFKASINTLLLILVIFLSIQFINYKSNDSENFINKTFKNYITQTRLPSFRNVNIVDYNNTIRNSNILIMGKDDKHIYYNDESTLIEIINNTDISICNPSTGKNKELSYIDFLVKLLNIKGEDYLDNNRSTDYKDLHLIANKRYAISQIKNIYFNKTIPKLKDTICKNIKKDFN